MYELLSNLSLLEFLLSGLVVDIVVRCVVVIPLHLQVDTIHLRCAQPYCTDACRRLPRREGQTETAPSGTLTSPPPGPGKFSRVLLSWMATRTITSTTFSPCAGIRSPVAFTITVRLSSNANACVPNTMMESSTAYSVQAINSQVFIAINDRTLI